MIKYNDEKITLYGKMLDNINDFRENSLKTAEIIKKQYEYLRANYNEMTEREQAEADRMIQLNDVVFLELARIGQLEIGKLLQLIGGYDE